jgi:hypothetical protein
MSDENQSAPPGNRRTESRWAGTRRVLLVFLATAIAVVGGCTGGAEFGGNYATDLSFLGMPGYEGSGLLGGLVSGLVMLLIGGVATEQLRRKGASTWVLIGALVAILFGPRLLFPVIPPQELALALTYLICAVVGSLIGLGVSTFAARVE